jgi:hypoxanthine phosphoribosyltransferase
LLKKKGAGRMKNKVDYEVMIDKERIAARVSALGKQITKDFKGEGVVCVGVLKGAFIFLADLVRAIDLPLSVEFIGVASYSGAKSTGHVRLTYDLAADVKGKNVLLIEDIIDTGHTIDYLLDTLKVRQPKQLKVAAFLTKPEAHEMHHKIDYVGFEISKEFVIGYGLDYNQEYRNLPFLGQVKAAL